MSALTVVVIIVVAIVLVRTGVRIGTEAMVAHRLPLGPDGIVPAAAPIRLVVAPSRDAVLLLHGFGDTPQTLRRIASELHSRGFDAYAPLLPGHGRTLRAFEASDAEDWIAASRAALEEVARGHDRVGVVGLSMGGALAAILAAESPDIAALVLLAPYVEASRAVRLAGRFAAPVSAIAPYLYGRTARSIHDPVERRLSVALGAGSPRVVRQLIAVADRARAVLGEVKAPTLFIQSREDNRISVAAGERTFAALASTDKRAVWVTGSGHVITVDYGWERVAALTADWLEQWMRGGVTPSGRAVAAGSR